QVHRHAQRQSVAALDEVAAGARRSAVHVVLPGESRHDVPGTDGVRILEAPGQSIAPRGGIRKPVRRFHFAEVPAGELRIAADGRARRVVPEAPPRGPAFELVLET